jgi:uncharacterized membrane protein
MEHVQSVIVRGNRSRWRVDGPAGTALEFEAEMTAHEPGRLLAWKTLPGETIEHSGNVRFESAGDGTRLHIEMTYRPPGGRLAHAIAHILGWDPKARMDDDLVRMKALLEDGFTRAHHSRISLSDVH